MSKSHIPVILAYTGKSLVDANVCGPTDKVHEELNQRSVDALADGAAARSLNASWVRGSINTPKPVVVTRK